MMPVQQEFLTIQEVGFSAASIRAGIGDIGPSFNVASASNGECVIAARTKMGS